MDARAVSSTSISPHAQPAFCSTAYTGSYSTRSTKDQACAKRSPRHVNNVAEPSHNDRTPRESAAGPTLPGCCYGAGLRAAWSTTGAAHIRSSWMGSWIPPSLSTRWRPRAGDAKELLADFRRQLAEAIRLPVDRAVALGEMNPDTARTAVALLVTFTLGVGVLMRSAAPDVELATHFEAAHAMVESWKIQH